METKKVRFIDKLKDNIIFGLLWIIATSLAASCRYKVVGWDKVVKIEKSGKGGLFLLWHAFTIPGIYYFRHRGYYSIVSLSKDGELQTRHLKSRGFNCIRGSSARQGIRALLEGIRTLKDGHIVALTPDGPKGPPKKVQSGSVHLAQKSGVPILPIGVYSSPCLRLNSWDKYMIPKPFCKTYLVFDEPFYIAPDESEETAAKLIEDAINKAQDKAEELATGKKN